METQIFPVRSQNSAKQSNARAAAIRPDESTPAFFRAALIERTAGRDNTSRRGFSTVFNNPSPAASASFGRTNRPDRCAAQIGDLIVSSAALRLCRDVVVCDEPVH
jgi:hypothetical protein